MAIIVKPYTFAAGAVIFAAEHNDNFDTLYNDYNGNIDNSNLAINANIQDSKLKPITTFNRVSGSALSSLASISTTAGIIPAYNVQILASLLTAPIGSVPYFSSIGTMSVFAGGTSGQFLMASANTGKPVWTNLTTTRSQLFATIGTDTFVNSASVSIVYVTGCGGGGGGATGDGGDGAGGGGGAGWIIKYPYAIGTTALITIGAGGTSGAGGGANNGTIGDNTIFGTLVLAGGNSGLSAHTGGTGGGGWDAPGSSKGSGSFNGKGGNASGGNADGGGGGGGCPFGSGGSGGINVTPATAPIGYGGGGGGGAQGGNYLGTNGAQGFVLVEW